MTRLAAIILTVTITTGIASCGAPNDEHVTTEAVQTTLLVNADIVTMNQRMPSAEAMAYSDGRIVAIGTEAEVREAIGDDATVQDLGGRTVVPGFFESHDHMFMSSASMLLTDVTPFTTPTLAEALEKIGGTEARDDGWILAFGADQALYAERRGPTRDLLDEIYPDTPVLVFHLSGHGGFANSEALRRAGIDENTPDPTGGFYEKDQDGRLTGYLAGQPALLSVKSYPVATAASALVAGRQRAAKGVTTSSEFAIMNGAVLDLITKDTRSADYPVRIVGGFFSTAPDEVVPRLKDAENELLKIPFIKTWTDGSLQGGTAHLSEGYFDPEMGAGGAQGTQEYFNNQVLRMYELGFWPAVHANGDAAADIALNAIQFAQESIGEAVAAGVRPQIIHAQYTRPGQIERMVELGTSPTFFTTHVYMWGDLHNDRSLGPDRVHRISAMADAFRLGARPSMHNDPPVTPVDPLFNMWISIHRTSSSGKVYGANQAITAEQALAAYTVNAAYQFGMEEDAGSLEVGKYADFVVLERNPLKVDPDDIRNISIESTVLGGRETYAVD
jgi:predicted amidohydrolase YtcJ